MDEMDEADIEEMVNRAIAARDTEQLREAAFQIETVSMCAGHFPEQTFDFLIALMSRQGFLELKESSHLFYAFEFEWDNLSDSQKERLLVALESSYAKFTDSRSWFKISVLLGECYRNREALEVLRRLRRTTQAEEARSYVSHGLEHIVDCSGDDSLSREAYAELLQMRNDPSEFVRDGVEGFLRELANAGFKYDQDANPTPHPE